MQLLKKLVLLIIVTIKQYYLTNEIIINHRIIFKSDIVSGLYMYDTLNTIENH